MPELITVFLIVGFIGFLLVGGAVASLYLYIHRIAGTSSSRKDPIGHTAKLHKAIFQEQ